MSTVLAVGDPHEPFCHARYLDFCKKVRDDFKCTKTVIIGDLIDNHAISYHEVNPNGMSASEEMKAADKQLQRWFKSFPKAMLCKGNHDVLTARKAITHGLPERMIKNFEDIWKLPKDWKYEWNFEIDNVRYQHGTGYSGVHPHYHAALANRQSTVIGHCHSVAGIEWMASDTSAIFGMSVGCGIDRMKYAFWYGKDFKRKPILSCGVIKDGREAEVVLMKM